MNLPSYDPARGELRGWIATITRNQRADRIGRNGQRLTDSIDSTIEGRDQSVTVALAQRIDLGQLPCKPESPANSAESSPRQ
jgi:hypothetical protein